MEYVVFAVFVLPLFYLTFACTRKCFTLKSMATAKIVILKNKQKDDGTFNVKFRITHKRQSAYIATPYYVGLDLINKKTFELKQKNNVLYDELELELIKIRQFIARKGMHIEAYSVKELADDIKAYLSGKEQRINFIEYGYKLGEELVKQGKQTGESYITAFRRFEQFVGKREFFFTDLSVATLMRYEEYLRNLDAKRHSGKITNSGINLYIGKLRAVFNKGRLIYNDEDRGIIKIPNNPFTKYKAPKTNKGVKRSLSVEQIRMIRDYKSESKFEMRARDVFMISFLLCGMNTVDLYYVTPPKDGRVEYERRKTRGGRDDNAFISICIQPELYPFIEGYEDKQNDRLFSFWAMYSTHSGFNRKINTQLKKVGDMLGIDFLQFYSARHSWATIARNECGISMDDIALSLNHKSGYDITDTYIKKDWSRIDAANRKVIDLIYADKKEVSNLF